MSSLLMPLLAGLSVALLVLGAGRWLLAARSGVRGQLRRLRAGMEAGLPARASIVVPVRSPARRVASDLRPVLAAGLAGAGLVATAIASGDPLSMVTATVAGGLAGWLAPGIRRERRARRRRREIRRAIPDAVDLLVVCVEAGLDLDSSLERVAREMARICEPLSRELGRARREMRAGLPRDEAMEALGRRTGVDEVRILGDLLAETHRLGTSVAAALWSFTDDLRERLRHRRDERAARVPIKLVFPLVLCILPATLVVVIVPVLLRLLRTLTGPG